MNRKAHSTRAGSAHRRVDRGVPVPQIRGKREGDSFSACCFGADCGVSAEKKFWLQEALRVRFW